MLPTIIITAIVTAIVVFVWQEYRHAIIAPVDAENPAQNFFEWQVFIEQEIAHCKHADHCQTSARVLVLFHRFFKNKVEQEILDNSIGSLWDKLDNRYRAITKEEKIGNLTTEELL